MRNLLDHWPEIAARLADAEAIALFLDFDGTLAPLRPRPEQVRLQPATRLLLQRLSRRPRLRVWVISGRRLADVRRRIGVPRVHYLGLHGWEGKRKKELSAAAQTALHDAQVSLARCLDSIPGIWLEQKDATFAIHYRAAENGSISEARRALRHALEPYGPRLRVIHGDRVWEVLPRELDGKGVAACRECRHFHRALPVYLGNDGTDEPAFVALSHGITVHVGPRRATHARFHLADPAEVRQFLERLEAQLR